MAQQEAVQPTTENQPMDPAKIRLQKKIRHAKIRKRLYQLYVLVLIIVTGLFGYHLVDYFIFQHNETAGAPDFGNRLEDIQPIPDGLKTAAANFGTSLPGVLSVDVDNRGVVIFIDVRVDDYTDLATAQSNAEQITNHFLESAGDLANGYNLQLVVSTNNPEALATENRRAAIDHLYNHFYFLAETTVAHAEEFPTQANISRAQENIGIFHDRFNNPEGVFRDNFRETTEGDVAQLQARLDAVVPWTKEEEDAQIEAHNGSLPNVLQGVERLVPQSHINDFPSWGTLNRETHQFQWN